ncbi:MAG TPA: ABC transporter permease [Acidimicrobiales bacterium]|nr:ABC transporter permease [Acidimicrobiales bacterium]
MPVLRSEAASSRAALAGLVLRDLAVMRKHLGEFVLRTIIQPFLLVFVFLFVFPKIGQSVGGGTGGSAAFATVLVPGVVGISVMFQGVQSVALTLAQEFGFTREIEDRVQAPCPVWLVAVSKVLFGVVQGILAAAIVFPIAAVVHATHVHPVFNIKWAVVVTLLPISCLAFSSLGLLMGCLFEPRNIGLMFGFIVLPITFLGGTYYQWTRLRPVEIGGFHWLQTLVLLNPLVYVNEGMRAAFTDISHMHLYVIYPVLLAFCALFLLLGIRAFRGRVLS